VQLTFALVRRWYLWILLGITLTAFIAVLFSPILRIREIRVQRTEARVDIDRVQELLLPLFGRHLFFLTRSEVTALMRQAVPDLERVSVQKNYPSELSVRVELKPFVARLTIDEPPKPKSLTGAVIAASGAVLKAGKRFDYLTTNTIYVSLTAEDPKAAELPLINITDWAVRPATGTPLFPPNMLESMNEAEKILTTEFGQKITKRAVYLRAREFHLAADTLSFWFDLQSPLEEQVGRLKVFLKSIGLAQAKSYIDLRLAGRVVYR
jgi:hypothetical protein